MDWTTVENRSVQDDQSKWDRSARGKELRMTFDAILEAPDENGRQKPCRLSDLATTQMCLEIPVTYYRRLSETMKAFAGNRILRSLGSDFYISTISTPSVKVASHIAVARITVPPASPRCHEVPKELPRRPLLEVTGKGWATRGPILSEVRER